MLGDVGLSVSDHLRRRPLASAWAAAILALGAHVGLELSHLPTGLTLAGNMALFLGAASYAIYAGFQRGWLFITLLPLPLFWFYVEASLSCTRGACL